MGVVLDALIYQGSEIPRSRMIRGQAGTDLDVNCTSLLLNHLRILALCSLIVELECALPLKRDPSPLMRKTPLHTALALKGDDVIRYLVNKEANMNIENCKGQTFMQCADEGIKRQIIQKVQSRSLLPALFLPLGNKLISIRHFSVALFHILAHFSHLPQW